MRCAGTYVHDVVGAMNESEKWALIELLKENTLRLLVREIESEE